VDWNETWSREYMRYYIAEKKQSEFNLSQASSQQTGIPSELFVAVTQEFLANLNDNMQRKMLFHSNKQI
jgi:hypothetical protein